MSIRELVAVVTPPENPLENGPVAHWDELQKRLGVRLPEDYKDFGLTFGTGFFFNEVFVFNPFGVNHDQRREEQLSSWRGLKESEGAREVPFDVFPQTPGLLPWGGILVVAACSG